MKRILFILLLAGVLNSNAQFISASLRVDGLTCSMCSKSVHKALSSLSFIDSIVPDLATASFQVSFKKDQKVILTDIRDKVEGAGFSVGELRVSFDFEKIKTDDPLMFKYEDHNYQFIDVSNYKLSGVNTFKVVDKGFVSKKEYKTNSKNPKYKCVYSPGAAECKAKATDHIIHITS